MNRAKSSIWAVAPALGIPESPALLVEKGNLWLAYFQASDENLAVVRFTGLIDHHLMPIGDEGLGRHPYVLAGLQPYSFNELVGSAEIVSRPYSGARHWVITFKDETLDVIARTGEVIASGLTLASPLEALLSLQIPPITNRFPND